MAMPVSFAGSFSGNFGNRLLLHHTLHVYTAVLVFLGLP